MNDYFLRILIRQRHAEIMAERRGIRHPQPEWPRTTFGLSHILRSILSSRKYTIVNQTQPVIERDCA